MDSREERMFLCFFSAYVGQNVSLFTEDPRNHHVPRSYLWVCSGSLPRFPTQTQNKGLVVVIMGTHFQLTVKSGIKWKEKEKKKTALQVVRWVAESVYFLGLDVEEELLGER